MPKEPAFTQIKYEVVKGRVAVISLNRPSVANAVSRRMTREIDRALKAAELDDGVRCIFLRGEGRNFSSGHDLGSDLQLADKTFPQEIDPRPRGDYAKWYNLDVDMALRWRRIRKPIVCGIKGYTIYHGTVLAACADIVIAADDLRYMPSLVEANLFPWVAGLDAMAIKHLLFSQRFATAEEAVRLGVALRSVPASELDTECLRLCRLIARGDSFHLWMMKKVCLPSPLLFSPLLSFRVLSCSLSSLLSLLSSHGSTQMVNAAQDVAGMEAHVRSSLDTWTAFRRDWSETTRAKTKDHGGTSKTLAPVKAALTGDAWRETEIMSKLSKLSKL